MVCFVAQGEDLVRGTNDAAAGERKLSGRSAGEEAQLWGGAQAAYPLKPGREAATRPQSAGQSAGLGVGMGTDITSAAFPW